MDIPYAKLGPRNIKGHRGATLQPVKTLNKYVHANYNTKGDLRI